MFSFLFVSSNWQLTVENALGHPTASTTMSISRTYSYSSAGLPAGRSVGSVYGESYTFDVARGNLSDRTRTDQSSGLESFGYDDVNRLITMGTRDVTYDAKGNVTAIDGVGSMSYADSSHPYRVTGAVLDNGLSTPGTQTVTYTAFDRPASITEGNVSAAFTYNEVSDRVKMAVTDGSNALLTRYYIGGNYEYDIDGNNDVVQRLYLEGDAYSAPVVYIKEGSGSWTLYNIARDYQGSIMAIATSGGTAVATYSYDPWGRLRNPANNAIYTPGNEPTLLLGRGYTGHEHLPWFGLINMNARLYDPLVGRFLSADPYVQAPDFTQAFNRYSYALNNPLRYTDERGEFAISTMLIVGGISAVLFGAGNVAAHSIRGDNLGQGNWAKYLATGLFSGFIIGSTAYAGWSSLVALSEFGGFIGKLGSLSKTAIIGIEGLHVVSTATSLIGGGIINGTEGVKNTGKLLLGNFYLSEIDSFLSSIIHGISRHTWEFLQTGLGYDYSQFRNAFGSSIDRVDYYAGATYATNESDKNRQGITLGNYINIDIWNVIPDNKTIDYYVENLDQMFAHEYGHTVQSRRFGVLYPIIGCLSLGSVIASKYKNHVHQSFFTETMANRYAEPLFPNHTWGTPKYPTK